MWTIIYVNVIQKNCVNVINKYFSLFLPKCFLIYYYSQELFTTQ